MIPTQQSSREERAAYINALVATNWYAKRVFSAADGRAYWMTLSDDSDIPAGSFDASDEGENYARMMAARLNAENRKAYPSHHIQMQRHDEIFGK